MRYVSIMDPDTAEDPTELGPEPTKPRPLTVKDHQQRALERAQEAAGAWEEACHRARRQTENLVWLVYAATFMGRVSSPLPIAVKCALVDRVEASDMARGSR